MLPLYLGPLCKVVLGAGRVEIALQAQDVELELLGRLHVGGGGRGELVVEDP